MYREAGAVHLAEAKMIRSAYTFLTKLCLIFHTLVCYLHGSVLWLPEALQSRTGNWKNCMRFFNFWPKKAKNPSGSFRLFRDMTECLIVRSMWEIERTVWNFFCNISKKGQKPYTTLHWPYTLAWLVREKRCSEVDLRVRRLKCNGQ